MHVTDCHTLTDVFNSFFISLFRITYLKKDICYKLSFIK